MITRVCFTQIDYVVTGRAAHHPETVIGQ